MVSGRPRQIEVVVTVDVGEPADAHGADGGREEAFDARVVVAAVLLGVTPSPVSTQPTTDGEMAVGGLSVYLPVYRPSPVLSDRDTDRSVGGCRRPTPPPLVGEDG